MARLSWKKSPKSKEKLSEMGRLGADKRWGRKEKER
jgi:hypothetical protein